MWPFKKQGEDTKVGDNLRDLLTPEEKDALIKRIRAEARPGAIVKVNDRELQWIRTSEYREMTKKIYDEIATLWEKRDF